jgi:hypothetical protein
MAAPHVAGLAARLAQAFPGISNSEIVSKLSTNNASSLAVTTFVEADVPAETTTTILDSTTTTIESTTTTVAPDETVPPTTTVAPTTTVPRATTTTTVRPNKPTVRGPKRFALKYQLRSESSVLVASWVGDNSPESYRLSCVAKSNSRKNNDEDEDEASLEAETLKSPTNKVINFKSNTVTYLSDGRAEIIITDVPTVSSRCWIVALIGTTPSERSNVAVTPKAPTAPTTTTTSTTSTTTTPTTPTTPTTTTSTTTEVPTTTTVSPPTTVVPARSSQTTQPKKITTTTKPPIAKKK